MATITTSDNQKSLSLTLTDSAMGSEDQPIADLFSALDKANTVIPIASVTLASLVLTVTLKDARVWGSTFSGGADLTEQYTSSDFWTNTEYQNLMLLSRAVKELVDTYGVTAATVTYA